MKKLFAIVAIAAFAVSCNNGTTTDAAADSLKKVDSIAKAAKEAVKSGADSATKKIDSTKTAVKDSIKSKM